MAWWSCEKVFWLSFLERNEQRYFHWMSGEKGGGEGTDEGSDKARAAWFARTKTEVCACTRALLWLRPGIFVYHYLCSPRGEGARVALLSEKGGGGWRRAREAEKVGQRG